MCYSSATAATHALQPAGNDTIASPAVLLLVQLFISLHIKPARCRAAAARTARERGGRLTARSQLPAPGWLAAHVRAAGIALQQVDVAGKHAACTCLPECSPRPGSQVRDRPRRRPCIGNALSGSAPLGAPGGCTTAGTGTPTSLSLPTAPCPCPVHCADTNTHSACSISLNVCCVACAAVRGCAICCVDLMRPRVCVY